MDLTEYERIRRCESAHFWYRGLHRLVRALLRRHVTAASPAILDAGCGTGGVLEQLTDCRRVGVDFSAEALRFCRERGLGALARGSVTALPLRSETFDAVVSLDVLYHAAVASDAGAIREFARVLKPGGVVVLNLPAHRWLKSAHDVAIHGARRYAKADMVALARAGGLEIVRLSAFNCALFPIAAAVRLLRRGGKESDLELPHPVVNASLRAVLRAEAAYLSRFDWPLGLSWFAVMRRPR